MTYLHFDIRAFAEKAESRMATLATAERFEEATEVRDRFAALIRGTSRGQRIRSLTRVSHLIAVKSIETKDQSQSTFELICVRYGRLAGSAQTSDKNRIDEVADSLRVTSEIIEENDSILPASSHEEVEKILRYLESDGVSLYELDGEWSMPTFGSAVARSQFTRLELLRSELSAHTFDH
jgi:DNA polymerase-3 subunit epsilon